MDCDESQQHGYSGACRDTLGFFARVPVSRIKGARAVTGGAVVLSYVVGLRFPTFAVAA
jgi:hypothetical protein